MNAQNRRVPFIDPRGGRQFSEKFRSTVAEIVRDRGEELIPAENHQRFYHGRSWTMTREDGTQVRTNIQGHTARGELGFTEIIQCQFSALPKLINSIATAMSDTIEKSLYIRVAEDAAAVGNTASALGRPTPEVLLEMIRKIEFSVDRTGKISVPSIHTSPENAKRLSEEIAMAGPAFEAEMNQLMHEKEAEAIERENTRLARFKPHKRGP